MYILNAVSAIQKMSIKELKKCVFENYHQQMRFAKEKSYYSMKHHKKDLQLLATKLTEQISDPCNAKKHYRS